MATVTRVNGLGHAHATLYNTANLGFYVIDIKADASAEGGIGKTLELLGQHINAISHLHGQMFACQALKRLQKLQTEVLGYKFKEPLRLLEALTHRTGKSHYLLPFNYEKLEILGDAILDYLANSNLLRFTLFERYLECDPGYAQNKDYKFGEDFNPGDAHQAKM